MSEDGFDALGIEGLEMPPTWAEEGIGCDTRAAPSSPATHEIVTEDSAALCFAALYGDRLRFCHSTGAWFEWNGTAWRESQKGRAFTWARELARDLTRNEPAKVRYVA